MKSVASKLVKCEVNVVAVQEVIWYEGGSEPPDNNTVSVEMGMIIAT
jgi:hypothetical protein